MGDRILVIDDDELVLISMEELLGLQGFEVTTAQSGEGALKKASEQTFDLVLLDVIMPGMLGFDVCRALREMDQYSRTPIILLTAKSAEADRKKGFDAGASRFLPKPIESKELLRILREELASR